MTEIALNIDANGRPSNEWNEALEYRSRVFETALSSWPESALEALRMDLTVADMPLLPRTFWLGPSDRPRCILEWMVRDIVNHNIPSGAQSLAGAEFWIQKRPGGRESILSGDDEETKRVDNDQPSRAKRPRSQLSIGPKSQRLDWHFDKDEELCAGTNIFLSPQISTVTYLTNNGGPTALLDCAAHPANGTPVHLHDFNTPIESSQALELVYPAVGRHLSFDGRRMHAVIPALQRSAASTSQPRITLLVNIWLGHIPLSIQRIPDVILPQLSPLPDDASLPSFFASDRVAQYYLPEDHIPSRVPRLTLFPGTTDDQEDTSAAVVMRPVVQPPRALLNWTSPAVRLVIAPFTFDTSAEPLVYFISSSLP